MIYGIGIDIAKISRFKKWYEKKNIIERYFHKDEISYIYSKPEKPAMESIAARFAAKEAFGKALGTGLTGLRLQDIAVVRVENGKPELQLYGNAKKIILEQNITGVYLSLSHEKEYAIAQVLLEKNK